MYRVTPLCEELGKDMAQLVKGLELQQVMIEKFSISVGHGHVQHAACRWTKDHPSRYHTHLILHGCDMKDEVALVIGESP